MKNVAFLLFLTLLITGNYFAQDQIILTRVHPTLLKHNGSYFSDGKEIVFSKEKGTTTLYYRNKPGKKLKKFKHAVDLSFFTDSLDYAILDNILTHSADQQRTENPFECEFRNKGSVKVTLKSGEAMAGKTQSYEFGQPVSCNDEKHYVYMRRLNGEYFKLYKLVFGK